MRKISYYEFYSAFFWWSGYCPSFDVASISDLTVLLARDFHGGAAINSGKNYYSFFSNNFTAFGLGRDDIYIYI